MSLQSMTGFARTDGTLSDGTLSWAWELRAVNGKGLDIRMRLPSGFESLEPKVRQAATDHLVRGNLNIGLSVNYSQGADNYHVNEEFLDQLIRIAAEKASSLPENVGNASLDGLLAIRGVIEASDSDPKTAEERDFLDETLIEGLSKAFYSLVRARSEEGQHLQSVLTHQLDEMESLTLAAKSAAATQPDALKVRLKASVDTLLSGSSALSPERLAQEVAVLATKADVREELDRLSTHIAQGRDLIGKGEPCGRRLEFLAQEFNREANTLCSKSTDVDLTKIGLDLKAVIDQFREQIQNVE
ncbi:MAG: YicC/YloC family endoribonuclease [Rhodospirillaceae bacterium]